MSDPLDLKHTLALQVRGMSVDYTGYLAFWGRLPTVVPGGVVEKFRIVKRDLDAFINGGDYGKIIFEPNPASTAVGVEGSTNFLGLQRYLAGRVPTDDRGEPAADFEGVQPIAYGDFVEIHFTLLPSAATAAYPRGTWFQMYGILIGALIVAQFAGSNPMELHPPVVTT